MLQAQNLEGLPSPFPGNPALLKGSGMPLPAEHTLSETCPTKHQAEGALQDECILFYFSNPKFPSTASPSKYPSLVLVVKLCTLIHPPLKPVLAGKLFSNLEFSATSSAREARQEMQQLLCSPLKATPCSHVCKGAVHAGAVLEHPWQSQDQAGGARPDGFNTPGKARIKQEEPDPVVSTC